MLLTCRLGAIRASCRGVEGSRFASIEPEKACMLLSDQYLQFNLVMPMTAPPTIEISYDLIVDAANVAINNI
jgi:hypothetical protein